MANIKLEYKEVRIPKENIPIDAENPVKSAESLIENGMDGLGVINILNEYGKDGWRMRQIDINWRSILLEREVRTVRRTTTKKKINK